MFIKTNWKFCLIGFGLGGLRGFIESLRLQRSYPLYVQLENQGWLFLQLIGIYAILIGLSGFAFISLFNLIFKPESRYKMYFPIIYFLSIVVIDLNGWRHPLEAPCRHLTFSDEKYAPDASNLLLITIDTCRADHLSMYGYDRALTPVLQSLSTRSILFCDAATTIPVTTPAHSSLLTAANPIIHGSRFNAVPLTPRVTTMAEFFSGNGYICGGFVSAFPLMAHVSFLDRGFSVYDQFLTPGNYQPLLFESTIGRALRDFGPFRPAERRGVHVTRSVINWWKQVESDPRTREKPVFTWVHYYDPHAPYQPDDLLRRCFSDEPKAPDSSTIRLQEINRSPVLLDEKSKMELISSYDAEIASVDRSIAELTAFLRSSGKMAKTWMVITADHGESLTEHGYLFSHGENLFEPSMHIPLLIIPPKTNPLLVPDQVSITDVFPTIASLIGMKRTKQPDCDGLDLSSIMSARLATQRPLYGESGSGVYIQMHAASQENIKQKTRSIRLWPHKFIFSFQEGPVYFNLATDPGESKPVRSTFPKETLELAANLDRYIEQDISRKQNQSSLPDKSVLDQLRSLGYLY